MLRVTIKKIVESMDQRNLKVQNVCERMYISLLLILLITFAQSDAHVRHTNVVPYCS